MAGAAFDPVARIFAEPERVLTDPSEFYAELHRHGAGVSQSWGLQVWGYDEVRSALRSGALTVSPAGAPPRSRNPWLADVITRMPSMTDGAARDVAIKALRSAFTPGVAGEADELARTTVSTLVTSAVAHGGPIDVIADVAGPALPMFLLGALGLEGAVDAVLLATAGDALTLELLPWVEPSDERLDCIRGVHDTLLSFVATQRGMGRTDLLGRLLVAIADDRDAVATILLLLVGGQETVTSLVATALKLLRQEEIAPVSLDDVVSEAARLAPPIHLLARTALTDIRVGSIDVGAGTTVLLLLGAALRDPSAFAVPDTPVWDRSSDRGNRAVAFGAGPHQCLGRNFAKLLAIEILDQIDRRLPEWRLYALVPRGWTAVPVFQGPKSLEINFPELAMRNT